MSRRTEYFRNESNLLARKCADDSFQRLPLKPPSCSTLPIHGRHSCSTHSIKDIHLLSTKAQPAHSKPSRTRREISAETRGKKASSWYPCILSWRPRAVSTTYGNGRPARQSRAAARSPGGAEFSTICARIAQLAGLPGAAKPASLGPPAVRVRPACSC